MTIARIFWVSAATSLLVGCGGNTGIRQGEPAQHAHNEPIVCPPEPEPSDEPEPSVLPYPYHLLQPQDVAALPPCSSIPKGITPWGFGCSLSERNTVCAPLDGRVYFWDPLKNCRKPGFRNLREIEKVCYETAHPFYPNVGGVASTMQTRHYCRDKHDGWIEMLITDDEYGSSNMTRLGWSEFIHSPCCPEGQQCLFDADRIDRLPNCH